MRGQVVDVSEGLRLAAAREVDAALEQLSQSRPVIDQAKGALMLTYALDADTAFELLRCYSQRANVKVREVAALLVEAPQQGWPERIRLILDQLVAELRSPPRRRTLAPSPGSARSVVGGVRGDPLHERPGRLPVRPHEVQKLQRCG